MDLAGRVAVVTGAGSGIGRSLAVGLAKEGMSLVLAGVNRSPLEATAKLLVPFNAECLCVPADVSQLNDMQNLADKALERFGQVHLLCNNAGVAPFGSVEETSIDDWQWMLGVNLWGPIYGAHVFLPIMEAQGVGHICSTASEAGLYGGSFHAAYNVSKFGVVGLMQSLARDLRATASPVTASVVCPSAVKSNIVDRERDRPAGIKTAPAKSEATQALESKIDRANKDGMDPSEAAGIVIAAIKRDQFWIFTHARVPETAFRQAKEMAERNVLIDI